MKLTIFLALLVGLAFGHALNTAATQSAKAQVYAVCNSARLEVSGQSERQCGDLQDKLGVEFLCEANNALTTNHCWTEAK